MPLWVGGVVRSTELHFVECSSSCSLLSTEAERNNSGVQSIPPSRPTVDMTSLLISTSYHSTVLSITVLLLLVLAVPVIGDRITATTSSTSISRMHTHTHTQRTPTSRDSRIALTS